MADLTPNPVRSTAALRIVVAVMEAIGSAGSLPSGELYAVLMSGLPGYSLTRHNLLIAKLIGEGFATETNNLLSLTKDGKVVLARTQAILGVTDLLTSMKGKSHV